MSLPVGYLVMSERCRDCLYGARKLVSNERRSEILRHLHDEDSWFVCHLASMAGVEVQCRADFEQRPACKPARIAKALGLEPIPVTVEQLQALDLRNDDDDYP